jgi:predicted O-linked N-acetylglucosamine transferase (SPINDLY family)
MTELVHQKYRLCEWKDLDVLSQKLLHLFEQHIGTVSSLPAMAIDTTPEQQYRFARRYARDRFRNFENQRERTGFTFPRKQKNKLTIGYLSADFREHAVAFLTAELFERHDRDRFRVFAYSCGRDDGSALRQRLVRGFDRFVDIQSDSFRQSAQRIYEDGVDILVDLTGYTLKGRTQILALRPAPIQISYLGYIGTLGTDFVDYIIVDRFVAPQEAQQYFSEKLVFMPECFQVCDSKRPVAPMSPTREQYGLPPRGFIFCCFNNSYKITPSLFDIWMRLLRALPDSTLWLARSSQPVVDNLRREAERRGVRPERLVFAPHAPYSEYLAQYQLADLFLDTLPYNAGTTANDALWMGCPLITCAGNTFVSRMAGSLLQAVGLPELITSTPGDYESLALRLAQQPQELARLRQKLATSRDSAPLFDCARFSRHLESAYQMMWETHQAGRKPASIEVPVRLQ